MDEKLKLGDKVRLLTSVVENYREVLKKDMVGEIVGFSIFIRVKVEGIRSEVTPDGCWLLTKWELEKIDG